MADSIAHQRLDNKTIGACRARAEQPGVFPRVTIGRDSWLGERAVVMADVGQHAIVAAGAVVTKPVPDLAVVAGAPATIIRWRSQQTADTGALARCESSCQTIGR